VHIKDIFTLSSCVFSYTNVKSRLFYGPTIVVEVSCSEKFPLGSVMCSRSTKQTQVKNRLFYVKDFKPRVKKDIKSALCFDVVRVNQNNQNNQSSRLS
jgi:hypothetical protein